MATLSATSSRALLRACERLGVDVVQILQHAGLSEAELEGPDARISLPEARALWQQALHVSGDPLLALHAAEATPRGDYRVLDLLLEQAPTVGEGLARVARYFRLINSGLELPVVVEQSWVSVGSGCSSDPQTRPFAEYTLACLCTRGRAAWGALQLARVDFAHSAPQSSAEYERIFRCPVVFGRSTSQLVLARHEWERARETADSTLFSVLGEHAELLLAEHPSGTELVLAVRRAIADQLQGEVAPSVARTARALAVSARTLQRRLREEGTSFADVLDAARRAAAEAYLRRSDVAVSEVAFLLGFADQSSFARAFKRWTGQAPSEFRKG